MNVVLVRVTKEMEQQLNALAESAGGPKSWLAGQAMQNYLHRELCWQMTQIKQTIVEADTGDFASDEEVATKMKRWGQNAS